MAQFTVTFDGTAQRLTNALTDFARATGWTVNVDDGNGEQIPNPVTAQQHVREAIKGWVKSTVMQYRSRVDADTARVTSENTASADIDQIAVT